MGYEEARSITNAKMKTRCRLSPGSVDYLEERGGATNLQQTPLRASLGTRCNSPPRRRRSPNAYLWILFVGNLKPRDVTTIN